MFDMMRGLVSQNKLRYKMDGFDLDLRSTINQINQTKLTQLRYKIDDFDLDLRS
jgi:hypothetical protein